MTCSSTKKARTVELPPETIDRLNVVCPWHYKTMVSKINWLIDQRMTTHGKWTDDDAQE